MKRFSAAPVIAFACLCLSVVLLPAAASGSVHVQLSPPLGALGQTLPAARSGQTYLWKLKVEGGTPPYHCVPQNLGIGTLALTTACKITGRAPVVSSMSVTGPFRFKVQDSSSPKKVSEFPSMNFTVLGPAKSPAAPPLPGDGWSLVGSGKDSDSVYAETGAKADIKNPVGLEVRVVGAKVTFVGITVACFFGSTYSDYDKTYHRAGLYVIPVPAGSTLCEVREASASGTGSIAVQLYAQTGAAPTPNPTPTPTPTPPPVQADPIVGTWSNSAGAVIDIEPSGAGFIGTVKVAYSSPPCTHTVGQQVWTLTRQGAGSYSGINHGFHFSSTGDPSSCTDFPQDTTWTIGAASGGTLSMVITVSGFGSGNWTRPYTPRRAVR